MTTLLRNTLGQRTFQRIGRIMGMVDVTTKDTTAPGSKSLSDKDIATYARRAGPGGGAAGTDVDAHADVDAVATDHDQAPAAKTDADTRAATDKD